MAEEIKQTLGFDAREALETLQQLDQALSGFESKLGTLSNSALVGFNSRAGKTVAALKQITDSANAAAAALGRANSAASAGGASGGSSGGGSSSSRSSSAGAKLLSGQAASDAFDKLLGNKTSEQVANADKLTQSLRGLGSAAEESFSRGSTATNKFSISWETMVRVIQTQFIVRALSTLRDAFGTALHDAIEFQRSIARIQTIAPGETFDKIAKGVRSISENFNIPLLQAAEGVYQAVSNQVGDLGESLKFTATAAQFAKATNASLADSIDLISGAIKSFGLSNDSAERVAGIFFTAIDKGRVTASELANTFGRVGPAAANVGISLEELGGAVAAISVKGIHTNESLTQFRGIITGLTKPTDAMKEKLAQMGFSSTQAAIETLHLDGVLEALSRTTHGSSEQFNLLFPNVRGLGGALSLTGKNLQEFANDVRAGQLVVADLNKEKFGTVFQTDAEQVTAAINKIKVALVVDFGQAILHSAKGLIDFAGGAERLVAAGAIAVPVLVQTGIAIGSITLALQGARLASLLFASSLGTVGTAATLAVIAIGQIKKAIDDKRLNFANAATDKLTKDNAEATTAFAKEERDKLDAAKKADQERVQGARAAIAAINVKYLEGLDVAKSANKALVENTEQALDKVVHARVAFIEAITKAIADSQEAIRESNRKIADFKLEKQDLQSTRQTANFSDAQKSFVLIQRSAQTARDAEQALLNAFRSGDKGDQEAAQRLFERAGSQLNAAKALGQGNKAIEGTIFNAQNALLDRRIGIEQRINALQLQRQKALQDEKNVQEKVVAELREQAKIAVANTGDFDANGNKFDAAQQARRDKARQDALKQIATLGFQQKDFDIAKALGLGDFIQKIQNDVTKRPIQVALDVERSVATFRASIQKAMQGIDLKLPFLGDLEKALGKSLRDKPDGINQGITEAITQADELRNKMAQVKINDRSIDDARREIDSLIKSIDARQGIRDQAKANNANNPEVVNAINNVDRFKQELIKLANQSKITQEDIDAIRAKINNGGNKAVLQINTDLDQLGKIADRIEPIKKALESTANIALPNDAQAKLAVLDSVLLKMSNVNPGLVLQTAATALQNTVQPVSTINTAISTSATNAERIAAAYQAAARVQLPAVPAQAATTQAFGGMIQGFNTGGFVKAMRYFDRGGFAPRGTDTVPAMLSPGEFVVNARSTRRFFSQLQAMNAGAQPVFRANGGSITNNHNVGDVSIAINGAQSPKLVGREVEHVLLRAKRRGTIR
jgi:TP901 family phage tail tape measure protein